MMVDVPPTVLPFLIFALRALINGVGTMRVIAMSSGRRSWGLSLASLESLMFAYTAGQVLTDLNNVATLGAYVIGFAVGGYIAMAIEEKFANVYDTVNIISNPTASAQIAELLRKKGFGVTLTHGEGARGEVYMLKIVVHHSETQRVIKTARNVQHNVFITVEQAQMIANGWIRSNRQEAS